MSELFAGLHQALPPEQPLLASHMWNCMGAVAGGMTHVVDMMFDNWPMAFQLIEGAKHGVQSPSGYYGFRVMRGFDDKGRMLRPTPPDALHYVGHHVDHELVDGIEVDCAARLADGRRRATPFSADDGRGRSAARAVQGDRRPLQADGRSRRAHALRQPRRSRRQLGVAAHPARRGG